MGSLVKIGRFLEANYQIENHRYSLLSLGFLGHYWIWVAIGNFLLDFLKVLVGLDWHVGELPAD
jgi:hypothetical protein